MLLSSASRPATAQGHGYSQRSCQWNLAQPGTGTDVRVTTVMRRRDVPRLVDSDVDLLQNCNGHSTIAKARRADDLLIVLHTN